MDCGCGLPSAVSILIHLLNQLREYLAIKAYAEFRCLQDAVLRPLKRVRCACTHILVRVPVEAALRTSAMAYTYHPFGEGASASLLDVPGTQSQMLHRPPSPPRTVHCQCMCKMLLGLICCKVSSKAVRGVYIKLCLVVLVWGDQSTRSFF